MSNRLTFESEYGVTVRVEPSVKGGDRVFVMLQDSGSTVYAHFPRHEAVKVHAALGEILGKTTPEPAPEPFEVGDRVVVLAATYADDLVGEVGTILSMRGTSVGDKHHPFRVSLDDGDEVHASSVASVPADDAEATPPPLKVGDVVRAEGYDGTYVIGHPVYGQVGVPDPDNDYRLVPMGESLTDPHTDYFYAPASTVALAETTETATDAEVASDYPEVTYLRSIFGVTITGPADDVIKVGLALGTTK